MREWQRSVTAGSGDRLLGAGGARALPSDRQVSFERLRATPSPAMARPGRSFPERWGKGLLVTILVLWASSFALGFVPVLMLLTLLGFGLAVVGIRVPALGVFGVGILCTLDALTRSFLLTGGLWRWNTFNYFLVAVILINIPLLLSWRNSQMGLLLALTAWLALGLAITPDFRNGLQHLAALVSLFGILVYFARAGGDRWTWVWLGLLNGSLGAAGGMAFFLQSAGLRYIDPNAWAFFPLTGLFSICLAFRFVGERRALRRLLIGLAGVNFGWVFLSASRGALLIAVCCMLVLISGIRGLKQRLVFVFGAVVLALLLLSRFAEQSRASVRRIEKLLDTESSLASRTSRRSDIALLGWEIFLENPWLGTGTGGFALTAGSLYRYGIDATDAHSAWVKTLAENAVPGLLLLAGFVVSFLVLGWRLRRHGVMYVGVLVTVALSTAFASTEFRGKGLWLLAGGVMVILGKAQFAARRARVGVRSVPAAPAAPGARSSGGRERPVSLRLPAVR